MSRVQFVSIGIRGASWDHCQLSPIYNLKRDVVTRLYDHSNFPRTLGTCVIIYIKRLLLRCIHHFKSDLIHTTWTICAFQALNPRQ